MIDTMRPRSDPVTVTAAGIGVQFGEIHEEMPTKSECPSPFYHRGLGLSAIRHEGHSQFTTFRGGLPSRTRRQFWLPLIRISSAPSSE